MCHSLHLDAAANRNDCHCVCFWLTVLRAACLFRLPEVVQHHHMECMFLLEYPNAVFAPLCVSCLLPAGEKKKPVKPATGTPSPKMNGQFLLQLLCHIFTFCPLTSSPLTAMASILLSTVHFYGSIKSLFWPSAAILFCLFLSFFCHSDVMCVMSLVTPFSAYPRVTIAMGHCEEPQW